MLIEKWQVSIYLDLGVFVYENLLRLVWLLAVGIQDSHTCFVEALVILVTILCHFKPLVPVRDNERFILNEQLTPLENLRVR